MRKCEKTSSARARADWLRNNGAPSSAPSTTKRIWPEWLASLALIARSIEVSTCFGKILRTRQRCSSKCLPMRLMLMSYQLPDAPPPPKLPPPPLNPPLSLELELPPDQEPPLLPPDQLPPLPPPPPAGITSANIAKTNAISA